MQRRMKRWRLRLLHIWLVRPTMPYTMDETVKITDYFKFVRRLTWITDSVTVMDREESTGSILFNRGTVVTFPKVYVSCTETLVGFPTSKFEATIKQK